MAGATPGFLERMFRHKHDSKQQLAAAPPLLSEQAKPAISPFGAFGEKGELVGEQIAYFVSRLDELYSLRQEFASVAKPMQDFIVSHAEAQTRLAETTALLARERADTRTVRSDALALRADLSRLESDAVETRNQIRSHEEAAGTRTAQLKSLQIAYEDASSKLDWSDRQLAAEVKANAEHVDARRGLGQDLDRSEQELANSNSRLLELKDHHAAAAAETSRLQTVVERLQPSLASAKRRVAELENDAGAAQATIHMLELKNASEQELRRSIELAGSHEKAAFENEISALILQTEALESRHATHARIFEQSRSLVNEKIEHIRQLERTIKDLLSDKTAMDRNYNGALDEIRRLTDQVSSLDTRHQDVQDRGIMLANALAAKDSQTEQLGARCETLKRQLEDAVLRHEQERVGLESHNRKLIEEVQSEQAERALAQGALSIARSSREKLVAQVEELRRNRLSQAGGGEDTFEKVDLMGANNIHKLRTPEPSESSI